MQVLVTQSDLPMYALLATHDSLSLNDDDVIISSCTFIIFAEQYIREALGC